MTICIAVNQGDYVFQAVDTRVTYGRPKVYYEDGHVKLYDTGIGMITGSGWRELLDEVKSRVIHEEINHTDQISKIVQDEIDKVRISNKFGMTEYEVNEHISFTGWFYSYLTLNENKIITRISYIHGSEFERRDPGTMKSLPEGSGMIWLDGSVKKEIIDTYTNLLNKTISSQVYKVPFAESGGALLSATYLIISEISKICDSVSKEFYIGFHGPNIKHIDGPIYAE